MSTSANICLTNVYDNGSKSFVTNIYQHWDGSPAWCGLNIANAIFKAAYFKPEDSQFGLNNRNWAKPFLAMFCSNEHVDFEFVGDDIISNYHYIIRGKYANTGGKESISKDDYLSRLEITVYKNCVNDPIFEGCPFKFRKFCELYREWEYSDIEQYPSFDYFCYCAYDDITYWPETCTTCKDCPFSECVCV